MLRSIVRSIEPAILHSWSNHTNIYAHWASLGLGVRRIVSVRGNPRLGFVDRRFGSILRSLNMRSCKAADCIVSNSRAAVAELLNEGVGLRSIHIVGNIVQARGRASAGDEVSIPRILAAGILVRNKAYDVLLHALARLHREGQSFEFLLAGDGPERAGLEELTSRLGLSDRVKFLGSIENVPDVAAGAHLVVHTSRSEGLSNILLEGMAEGVPVVATDVGGTPELVTDGETGMLVPPDDPVLLAAKIKQLLNDPALRSRLGDSALSRVRARYNGDVVARQYERIYRSLSADGIDSKASLRESVSLGAGGREEREDLC
jgi:glycosyltransferase involved in cell wall biosynthesis